VSAFYPKFDSWPNDVLFTRKISKIVEIGFDSWVIFMGYLRVLFS